MGMAALVGQTLLPGEIVKNSGKFSKPTKIPGKNYSKDEIIIRNADSGKGEFNDFTIQLYRFNKSINEILIALLRHLHTNTNSIQFVEQWWELKDAAYTL